MPCNRNIFDDCDFAPSRVTNREMRVNAILNENSSGSNVSTLLEAPDINKNNVTNEGTQEIPQKESQPIPSTSGTSSKVLTSTPSICVVINTSKLFSPEEIRPFSKAQLRKTQKGGRKKRGRAVVTDTPVKTALEEESKQMAQLDARQTQCRRLDADTTSTPLVNKLRVYILASSWLGIESAASSRRNRCVPDPEANRVKTRKATKACKKLISTKTPVSIANSKVESVKKWMKKGKDKCKITCRGVLIYACYAVNTSVKVGLMMIGFSA